MTTLTYFTVTGFYAANEGTEEVPLDGQVTFTPMINTNDPLQAVSLTPPTNLFLSPTHVPIDDGYVSQHGSPGVQLVANTAALNLSGPLYYTVKFSGLASDSGGIYTPESFSFAAPTSAATIDLVIVAPATTAAVALGSVEPPIAAGANGTYWRGDKTWQSLNKDVVIRRPRNNRVTGCGASITTWRTLDSSYMPGCYDNFTGHLCVESDQRMKYAGVVGHGGYTQAQMLSLYLPVILAMDPAPGACIYIDACYNDIATGVSFAQTKANLNTVIGLLLNKGILPILGTVPAHYYTSLKSNMAQWNRYIRRFAATNGFPLIDMQSIITDINAANITSLTNDPVHPNELGHQLIAQEALARGLADIFPPAGDVLTSKWIGDTANLLTDGTTNFGLFNADTNTDGVADGWTLNSGLAGRCSVVPPQTGDNLVGNWQRLTAQTGDTYLWLIRNISGVSTGDILSVSAKVRTSGVWTAGAGWTVGLVQYFAGGYTYPSPGGGVASPAGYVQGGCPNWLTDLSNGGTAFAEVPVLAGSSQVFAQLSIGQGAGGTASVDVGEFTIINLTTGAYLT